MTEQMKPMDIEKRSFAIITELLGDRRLDPENELVIKRVIHTTADFDYVDNLVFSDHAVQKAIAALRAGCDIVTDTQMAKAGINKTILASLGGEVHCFMSDADVAAEAKERGVTRAFVSMERAAALELKNVFFVVGDAALVPDYFAPGEVDLIYINFCDPWPPKGQAKRRLTHRGFLATYRKVLKPAGEIHFKTDNGPLLPSLWRSSLPQDMPSAR